MLKFNKEGVRQNGKEKKEGAHFLSSSINLKLKAKSLKLEKDLPQSTQKHRRPLREQPFLEFAP